MQRLISCNYGSISFQLCKEQQDKRFDQEKGVLLKNYENDLQSMVDQQKKQVDKAEEQQHVDIKVRYDIIQCCSDNMTVSLITNLCL